MSAAALPAASPCIGICRLHDDARVCIGCGRTGDEIAGWRRADDAERHAVVSSLPARLSALDAQPIPNGWPREAVRLKLRNALARRGTAIMVGCYGAVAEFMVPPGETPRVAESGATLEGSVTGGTFRLTLPETVGAFTTSVHQATPSAPILLAARGEQLILPVARGLTRLGFEHGQLQRPGPAPDGRERPDGAVLFDLGLGHAQVRFMVRTADPAVAARLDALEGAPLAKVLAEAGSMLVEASPDRIVESPLARVEVTTPIPPPSGRSPMAPHTHLMPGVLALRRLLPPGIACPNGHVPVALVYCEEGAL